MLNVKIYYHKKEGLSMQKKLSTETGDNPVNIKEK